MHRDSGQSLVGVHTGGHAGQGGGQGEVLGHAGAGIAVGGQCHRHSRLHQLDGRGEGLLPQEEIHHRQQHSHGAGSRQGRHPRRADELQMVGAGRAQLRRQLRAAARGELIDVEPQVEAA